MDREAPHVAAPDLADEGTAAVARRARARPRAAPSPWGLAVEVSNFGPIRKARVDLRSLTVLTGSSQAGKTMLARTIYALTRSLLDLVGSCSATGQAPTKEIVESVCGAQLRHCLGRNNLGCLVRRGVEHAAISIDMGKGVQLLLGLGNDGHLRCRLLDEECIGSLSTRLGQDPTQSGQPLYLPTDRSALFRFRHLNGMGTGAASFATGGLPGTVTDFLSALGRLPDRHGNEHHLKISGLIEKEILRGRVEAVRHEDGAVRHHYLPAHADGSTGREEPTPLVAGLVPLVVFLRHLGKNGFLFVEEPEIHLDPETQVKLLQLLARCVATGLRVVMTTHSEWVTEMLSNVVGRAEMAPDGRCRAHDGPRPALRAKDVGVWHFDRRKGNRSVAHARELGWGRAQGGYEPGYGSLMKGYTDEWIWLAESQAHQ